VAIPGICVLLGMILNFIGPIVCLAVPSETGAKGFIIASVIFQLFNVVSSIGHFFAPTPTMNLIFRGLGLLGIVGFVCFVLFMKKLGKFIDRTDFVVRANNILYGWIVLIVLGVAAFLGVLAEFPLLGLLGFVVAIGALIVFVMYVNLIDALRKALRGDTWNS
jgi:hypothetical protein